ncbi:hypothetical protein N0V93_004991 [Gnomoniopsis smithogilvyi]|uniref:Uncharacterized protein n=1 Tax=Gnomoniopsis smithogilvyi TaxID=1191159 RepID=A0A9W8YSG6_9PEZI|nr:hypothetical protein N0V93_004991 [Gnomoniopsis smithogilvyi]
MNRLLSASDPLVHSVLVALCDDDRVQARALKYLAELEDYATKIASGDADVTVNESSSSNPLKRKASMPAQLCIMCKRAFSPGDNSPTACLYHEGQLMIDESHETWADWDEDVGGPQITPENEEDYPQAFLWSCCDENGTAPGCVKGYHLAVRKNSSKRFRISFPPGAEPDKNRTFEGRTLRANEFVNEALGPNQSAWGPSSTIMDYETTDDSASVDTERNSEGDAHEEDTTKVT